MWIDNRDGGFFAWEERLYGHDVQDETPIEECRSENGPSTCRYHGSPKYYYMNYPTDNCPGDGYLWDNRTNKWFRPQTVAEYERWYAESFLGESYVPSKHKTDLTDDGLNEILSFHKAPPKGFGWH